MDTQNICSLCAWRATCQKKFSMSGKDMHCPDFCRDVTTIQKDSEPSEPDTNE